MSREIEVKIFLGGGLYETVESALSKIAELKKDFRQVDRYFNAPHRDFLEPEHPLEYFRLRDTEGIAEVTYKHIHLSDDGQFLYADEHETEIKDAEQLLNILKVLNFEELITIDKNRKEYEYEGKLEIVLDRVKDLGNYIELETKVEFDNLQSARKYIFSVVEKLGLSADDQCSDGYVLAMMKKKGLR